MKKAISEDAKCVKKKVKFHQSVMVRSCMSATGVANICFLKRPTVYQHVLDHLRIQYIADKFGDNEFIFQHDSVLAHTVKFTKELCRVKIPVLD